MKWNSCGKFFPGYKQ